VDGFRYGFFAAADLSPWLSLAVVAGSFFFVSSACVLMLRVGYRLRW
jgi:ABC-2 type transport system permease protein